MWCSLPSLSFDFHFFIVFGLFLFMVAQDLSTWHALQLVWTLAHGESVSMCVREIGKVSVWQSNVLIWLLTWPDASSSFGTIGIPHKPPGCFSATPSPSCAGRACSAGERGAFFLGTQPLGPRSCCHPCVQLGSGGGGGNCRCCSWEGVGTP